MLQHAPKRGGGIIKQNKENRRLLIQGIKDLPTLPIVFRKMIEMVEDEKTSVKDLSDLLSKDQSIMSSILKLVNSAFYGYQGKIASIKQAIVILGFSTIRSIALGTSIFSTNGKKKAASGFDRNALWIHSLGVATGARILAIDSGYKDIEEAFAAGLLHDVGKVVFDAFFSKDFREVLKLVKNEKIPMRYAEKEILGLDHAEAARILLKKWQLPEAVTSAASYHHNLHSAPNEYLELASMVSVSNRTCCKLRIGSGGDRNIPLISKTAIKALKLTSPKISGIEEKLEEAKENILMFELT